MSTLRPAWLDLCHFCGENPSEVDIEIINLSEKDIVASPACKLCATHITLRSSSVITADMDDISYATIGVVGGSPEETN